MITMVITTSDVSTMTRNENVGNHYNHSSSNNDDDDVMMMIRTTSTAVIVRMLLIMTRLVSPPSPTAQQTLPEMHVIRKFKGVRKAQTLAARAHAVTGRAVAPIYTPMVSTLLLIPPRSDLSGAQ